MKRSIGAGVAILVAWTLFDAVTHRLVLAPLYEANSNLWRPFDQMSTALICAVTLVLISVFVGVYRLLVRPKSLRAGLSLGAFLGLALGISSGFGTFIHMPIPLPLAWGWFVAGCLKGVVAGGIVGAIIVDIDHGSIRSGPDSV
jgi:hypothetical protein